MENFEVDLNNMKKIWVLTSKQGKGKYLNE